MVSQAMMGNKRGVRHGMCETKVYRNWKNMIARCHFPANRYYNNYGGRGITVCDRWRRFDNFYADMGSPPPGMSIDRINNDGNYEPGNCRWATHLQQGMNRRTVRHLEYNGETLTLREWSERFNVKYTTLRTRLVVYGWPMELALNWRPS